MRLLLRVFAECLPGNEQAAIGEQLLNALASSGGHALGAPERYWKIPEWAEFTFSLPKASASQFDAFLAMHPGGWTHTGEDSERSSVWNPPPEASSGASSQCTEATSFLHNRVRWAELILTHANDH